MINNRIRGVNLLHGAVLVLIGTALFWIWFFTLFGWLHTEPGFAYYRYALYSFVLVGALGSDFVISKLRGTDLLQLDFAGILRLSFRQTLTVFGGLLLFLVASKDVYISRFFLFGYAPLLFVALIFLNRLSPRFLAAAFFSRQRRERTLILGSASQARAMVPWFLKKARYGLEIVGFVPYPATGARDFPWPVVGHAKDLGAAIASTGATQVIALHLPNSIPRAARLGDLCERAGVRLLFVNDIEDRFEHPIHFFEESGVRFVSLREEPLECPFNRLIKRGIDIAISLPVVLFILPFITAWVWLIQRWQSPGPIFFRQVRSGIQARGFHILKYRTMHVANPNPTAQATQGDLRVYPLGRLLRRLSIDELPQFINVLRGEMSVVGPRPHMVEHDTIFQEFSSSYRVRALVKPGITGLAQINGFRGEARDAQDIVARVRTDVFYLEHWSFLLDWVIIFKTAWQMLRPPKTAY